ncbi:MAG: leucine-rich repeat protein [Clostridia bacterium]|nr:leucine-rich repeat protein [Clostridia bacterium]
MQLTTVVCPICGALLPDEGVKRVCRYCKTVHVVGDPQLEHDFAQANVFRESTRFREAEGMYRNIIKSYPDGDLSDAYWNLFLCKQRVMFETDEKGERFPSFYAVTPEEIVNSPDCIKAVEYAERYDPEKAERFREMIGRLEQAKRLYRLIDRTTRPYDVFICFKKTSFAGGVTRDHDLAYDLYNHFASRYRVFFSEKSLKDVAVREYEPNIYYGLYTAKVMLVLCSKREYLGSQWVKNEWSRFYAFTKNTAANKTIVPIFIDDFTPGMLPEELVGYQGLHADVHLIAELERTLERIIHPVDMEKAMEARLGERDKMWAQRLEEERLQREEEQKRREEEQRKREAEQQKRLEQMEEMLKKSAAPSGSISAQSPELPKAPKTPKQKASAQPKSKPLPHSGDEDEKQKKEPKFLTRPWIFVFIAVALMLCAAIAVPIVVYNVNQSKTQPTYVYEKGTQGVRILSCSNAKGDLTIPEIIDGATVFSIGEGAFKDNDDLTSVMIPSGVKEIGASAFYDCNGLTRVVIGQGVGKIGEKSFAYCTALTDIAGWENVETIGARAFSNCTSLGNVTIPKSVRSLGEGAFSYCSGLESITAPDNVVYHSVSNCLIHISDKILVAGCSKSVIPTDGSVTSIAASAFAGCIGVTNMTIPESITSIDQGTFRGCTNLTDITIGKNVATIGIAAFSNCPKLSVVYYGGDQGDWERISIGASNESLLSATIHYNADSTGMSGGALIFTSAGNGYAVSGIGTYTASSLVIPDTYNGLPVTSIAANAFDGCKTITDITIPSSITSIGNRAFRDCTAVTAIYFNATALEDLDSQNYVFQRVGKSGDGITVYIGANVTKIPACLLYSNGDSADAPNVKNVTFAVNGICTSIGDKAFANLPNLESITIPESIISIGNGAFYHCANLNHVIFEDTLGWSYSGSATASSGTDIAAADLADTVTAATYLTDTYCNYYWYCLGRT